MKPIKVTVMSCLDWGQISPTASPDYDLAVCANSPVAKGTVNASVPPTAKLEICPLLDPEFPAFPDFPTSLADELRIFTECRVFSEYPPLKDLLCESGSEKVSPEAFRVMSDFGTQAAKAIRSIIHTHRAGKILVVANAPWVAALTWKLSGEDFLGTDLFDRKWPSGQSVELIFFPEELDEEFGFILR